MPPKKERLTRKEFDTYFKNGRRFHTPFFTLVYKNHEVFHGAVVVGKKIAKKAVTRNSLRRRTYTALYGLKKELGCTGVYIVLTKPPIVNASHRDIKTELEELIGRIQKTG